MSGMNESRQKTAYATLKQFFDLPSRSQVNQF